MRPTTTTQENSTTDIKPVSPWRVKRVKVLDNYQLEVEFLDGLMGKVDLKARVNSDKAGVFASLKDEAIFKQVFVHLGVVTWPGEIDLAPEVMYENIKNHGIWVLSA